MNKLLIITTLVIVLLLTSCATNPGNSAGKVNGTYIPRDEFISAYRGHYANFSYATGRSPDKDEKELLFKETWKNITRFVVLKDYYNKYKISATPREVIDTLSTSIPSHILASPAFKKNGAFDKNLYLQSLLNDRPENLAPLRRHYQENLIPIMKLQSKLIENELISTAESKQIAKILSSNADMELYIFDPKEVQVHISENEVITYYNSNLNKYSLKPYHSLGHVLVPVVPEKDDHLVSKVLADSIYTEVNNGLSANNLVLHYKGNKALLSVVDNGFVKTQELPTNLQDDFALLKDGECLSPIRTESGWVIYQKLQSTKTLTDYISIYVQTVAGQKTSSTPETKVKNIRKLAQSIGLSAASEEFELPYTQLNNLPLDSLSVTAPDIKKALLDQIAKAKKGDVIEPIFSTYLSAWVIVQILDSQTKTVKPITEVEEQIVSELTVIRKQEINRQRAQQWASTRLLSSTQPPMEQLKSVNINTLWQNAPLSLLYYKAAKAYIDKQDYPAVDFQGVLVVPVVKQLRFTEDKVAPEQIRAHFMQMLPENWFDTWLENKVQEAKVMIYNTP